MKLKIDIHTHSRFSKDGLEDIEAIILKAKEVGLGGMALTDHNTIEGLEEAMRLSRKHGLLVIPGEEIKSRQGDILALGINKHIPKGLDASETICMIHRNGGVAIAAHPYSSKLFHHLSVGKLAEKLDFDAIEVLNSRTPFGNKAALMTAIKRNIPRVSGSDAHMISEIGNAYTIIESKRNIKSILSSIKKGKTIPYGKLMTPAMQIEWYARRFFSEVLRTIN
jgi:predicted metal-dependent phosphoesterase TrpH